MSGAYVSLSALEHQRERRARNKRVARALASGQRMSHEDALAIVAAVRADRLRKEAAEARRSA